MKVFGVVGWKNAGKTTLVERLVTELSARGLTVSTIKRAHHQVDVDQEGTNSWRHRAAGAHEVMLASSRRWALMHERREGEAEATLEALLARMRPADLVLVEGFKRDRHPKVEIHRAASGGTLLALEDDTVRAVVSDVALAPLHCPVLGLDDVSSVADLILADTGLTPAGTAGASAAS